MGAGAAGAAGATETEGGGLAGAMSSITPWATAGLGVVNLGMSLVEASKQKDLQRSAQRAAEQASAEQKRIQGQNFFEALQVPTEAYQRQFREGTAQQMQAVSALQEGDSRALAGGVGKVQAIAGEQSTQTREALADELFNLGKYQAMEQGQTSDEMADIYGKQLAGAQLAAANAENTRMEQLQNALGAGAGIITSLTDTIPEYSNTETNKIPLNMNSLNQMQQSSLNTTNAFQNRVNVIPRAMYPQPYDPYAALRFNKQ